MTLKLVRESREVMKRHPRLREGSAVAVEPLAETGTLPEGHSLHTLNNQGGNYSSHMDFHLSDGLCDGSVNKGCLSIRFVCMGTHKALLSACVVRRTALDDNGAASRRQHWRRPCSTWDFVSSSFSRAPKSAPLGKGRTGGRLMAGGSDLAAGPHCKRIGPLIVQSR